jgi:hypothetical protein
MSTLGTVTGNAQIGGLPFTSENVANLFGDCHMNGWNNLTTAVAFLAGEVLPNTTSVTLVMTTAAATSVSTVAQGDLSNTADLVFKVIYQASA